MTPSEKYLKCLEVANMMKSFEGHNKYSQKVRNNVVSVGIGSGDCSSTVGTAYKKTLGTNIGTNTVAQMTNKSLVTLDTIKIVNGVPDEKALLPGDLLYFRGTDPSRKSTKYVGHVEMYVGDGELSGHGGPRYGPTRKKLVDYCNKRYNTKSAKVSPANKGLICVRRAVDLVGAIYPDINKPNQTIKYFPAYSGDATTIIDALKGVGCYNTSYEYRKTIAEANNISNYIGSVSQNNNMVTLLKMGKLIDPSSDIRYYPAYLGTSTSIVIALREAGCRDTGIKYRKKIAAINHIDNYTGTAIQNTHMLNLLKTGKLINPSLSC